MTDADKPAFAALMQGLCAVRRTEPSKALLAGYWMVLQGLTLPEFEIAVRKALEEDSDWMPNPGALRKFARPATVSYYRPVQAALAPLNWDKFAEELAADPEAPQLRRAGK